MAGRFNLTPQVGFLQDIEDALNDMKLTDMQNIDFTGLANGDSIVWNSGTLKWECQPASGGVSDGDKGDITVSGGGSIWSIDDKAVWDAKMTQSNVRRLIRR